MFPGRLVSTLSVLSHPGLILGLPMDGETDGGRVQRARADRVPSACGCLGATALGPTELDVEGGAASEPRKEGSRAGKKEKGQKFPRAPPGARWGQHGDARGSSPGQRQVKLCLK